MKCYLHYSLTSYGRTTVAIASLGITDSVLPLLQANSEPSKRITSYLQVEWKRNVMAYAQKPDLVFQRNGRVHLYRRGCQFSRLLAAEVCASAVVMLDRPCSDTVQDCWLPTPFASFPFTSPSVLRRVPPDSVSTLQHFHCLPEESALLPH